MAEDNVMMSGTVLDEETHSPPLSRRERKKQLMRESLIKVAYELFESKGFDETRVEDITERVDVSVRTFFRYFASKEDVLLDYQEAEHRDLMAQLKKRPPHEPVLTALRRAAVSTVKGCEECAYGFDADRFMTLQNLIRNNPVVRAHNLEKGQNRLHDIAHLLAERMGVDPATDMRPLIAAGTLEFAYHSTYELWKKRKYCDKQFSDLLSEVFSVIEQGINFPAKR
ncbi:TetR family transcriptional regulator [Serratia ureilytica]|uniref:TetR family transcriptional regulator n=1 Tax=Serratia ureilytica TaxID=300181 RepID=UPI001D181F93|nr:TetR family transcriptional regulator [Serratia ureilytica]MCC4106501.1 TetR family transcriptional regulator [Serratia ureilytica]